jgi:hypothetical protein
MIDATPYYRRAPARQAGIAELSQKSGPGFLFDAGSGFVLIFGHTA